MTEYDKIEILKKRIANNKNAYIKEALDNLLDSEIEKIANDLDLVKPFSKQWVKKFYGKTFSFGLKGVTR